MVANKKFDIKIYLYKKAMRKKQKKGDHFLI